MNPRLLTVLAALGGAAGAGSFMALKAAPAPRYYWYAVPQTDSIRALLNANPGARLKLEERTKDHIWISVMRPDSAAKVVASFEVEESWPCPPNCK